MVGAIGGFNIANFAVNSGLARQKTAAASDTASLDQITKPSAKDVFLDYMKKTPAERMQDAWLKAHGLTKEKLEKMSPQEQKAVMKQMQDDIERSLKEDAQKPTKVDILA